MTTPFEQLVRATMAQPEPQRLLFLLARTEQSNKKHKSIARGTISPVICVDKQPSELSTFDAFIKEADGVNASWDMILIAGMDGENGQPPSSEEAEPLLNKMANDLVEGQDLSRYFIIDREGNQVEMVPGG